MLTPADIWLQRIARERPRLLTLVRTGPTPEAREIAAQMLANLDRDEEAARRVIARRANGGKP